MIEMLKEIILDFQDIELLTGVPRRLKTEPVNGKATVCIGVRRCGKSTYLFQIIKKLLDNGVLRQNILYMNFFDDRLYNLNREGPGIVMDAYFSLYPEKKNSEKIYCFFDEIQSVSGWEPFIDRILRTENCEVYITGSSAKMLSKEIATQMRGRALSWEVFPFSFREFLDFKKIEVSGNFSSKRRLLVQKAFGEYLEDGGFPEVAGLDKHLRIKIHQEYYNAVLFRDIVERHDILHPKAITDLAHWMIDNISSLYTINRLSAYLQSSGHKIAKSSVSDYIKWFEDAYFFFTVRIFDASLSKANVNPKKIYCIDHSLVNSVTSGILVNSGHLLENLVFTTLRRVTPDIFYYRTKNRREVDFIAQLQDRSRMLIQVCESLANPRSYQREVTALEEAMKELGLDSGAIVTLNEERQLDTSSGKIKIIPAWRFILEMEE